MTTSTL